MKAFTAALIVTATVAVPAVAMAKDGTRHLDHLLHGGLGKVVVDRETLARLPKAHTSVSVPSRAKPRPSDRLAAERAGYKAVTGLTNGAFPPFYPGLGEVYVRPKSLPVGPFLTFDRKGHQISTVYMLSLEEMNGHKKFDATGTREPRVNHVTVYYHGGHPGVDFPHYHYVLWHVTKDGEKRVAK